MDEYLAIPEAGPSTPILNQGARLRYLAPTDASLESSWYLPEFDDSDWLSGTAALGY